MIKKAGKIIFIILLIAVCIFSVIQKTFLVPIHNVFDEMYYSAYGTLNKESMLPWGSWITLCDYRNVEAYTYPHGDTMSYTIQEFGYYSLGYKESKLNEREKISIYPYIDKKMIVYWFCVMGDRIAEGSEPPSITWHCEYSIDENTMYIDGPKLNYTVGQERIQTKDEEQITAFFQEQGLTKTVEEYEHYFLYDKIIHDWTLGNLFRSKYATWWIGSVKFVDGPPPEQTA